MKECSFKPLKFSKSPSINRYNSISLEKNFTKSKSQDFKKSC